MTIIPAMITDDYNKYCLRTNWVIECVECIKDATKHLREVEFLVKEGLSCDEYFVLGGDEEAFQENISKIAMGLKAALMDIAIFSDQFDKKENKRTTELSGALFKIAWTTLECTSIKNDAFIKLARYMRNYFSHVRTGRQSFNVFESSEIDHDKACQGDWTAKKYYKIDINKMLSNNGIVVPTNLKIEDFSELFTDQEYTDLCGNSTGEFYIDVGKFANSMISRLQFIWETFVKDNSSEWDKVKSELNSFQLLQIKLVALNEALDATTLHKLGWYNINGEYIPSKFDITT